MILGIYHESNDDVVVDDENQDEDDDGKKKDEVHYKHSIMIMMKIRYYPWLNNETTIFEPDFDNCNNK